MWLAIEPTIAHRSFSFFRLGVGFYTFATLMDLRGYIRTHGSISMDRYASEQKKPNPCLEKLFAGVDVTLRSPVSPRSKYAVIGSKML